MISDREKEEELLRYALELQNMWHLTGTDRSYKKEGSRSSKGCADSRVASALYAYFAGYSRFHQAVEFFLKRAAENDPECAVYAAKAINAMVRESGTSDTNTKIKAGELMAALSCWPAQT